MEDKDGDIRMINIGIVGAGKGGTELLRVFLTNGDVNVIGITDNNQSAQGLKLARENGIFASNNIEALIDRNPHIIINATGEQDVTTRIRNKWPYPVEVIEGTSAWFLWELVRRQQEAKKDLEVLYKNSLIIAKSKSLDEVLEEVLDSAMELTETPAGSISLIEGEYMVMAATKGLSDDFFKEKRWKPRERGLSHYIFTQREPVEWEDISKDPIFSGTNIEREGIRSLLASPLLLDGGMVGILYIDDFKPRRFTERHKNLIKLFSQFAAHAIEKFRLIHQLDESLAYFQAILDNSQDMIVTTDTEGKIVKFSKGGERIIGYREKEVVGKKAAEFYLDPKEREKILEFIKVKGSLINYETKLLRKDMRPVDISLTISQLRDRDGKIIGTVGVSKDITEEKRLKEELIRKNKELEELNENLEEKVLERTRELEKLNNELKRANQIKARFIANMSHELRTPLTSIIGYSELFLDKTYGELNGTQEKYITHILQAGRHLLHLVNNILDLAKIESGRLTLSVDTISVPELIDEVIFVMKPHADKKDISIKKEIDSDVTQFTADRVKLKQILYNLLNNAVKFTEEGGMVGIRASYVSDEQGGVLSSRRFLKISVWDTGLGIKEEDRERIFEEFEQVDPSRSTEGAGLGLPLTKRLVELHGGHINLRSEYGKGSEFSIYLPLKEALKETRPKIPQIREEVSPLVLVVEDDLPTSELIGIYLKEGGYLVEYARDGREAIEKARILQPFAILLDIMLPEKDGWEVLQTLKSDPETMDIPVIIHSIIEDKETGFMLGATDYLLKPADKPVILKKLGEISLLKKRNRVPVNILILTEDRSTGDKLKEILESENFIVHVPTDLENTINIAMAVKPDSIIVDLTGKRAMDIIKILKVSTFTRYIPVYGLTDSTLSLDERIKITGHIERLLCKDAITSGELIEHLKTLEILHPMRAGLIDEITGVFNHRYLQIRLAQEIARCKRYKVSLALSLIKIDHFDNYMDKKGIYYGNLVLKKIAEILKKNLRSADVLTRFEKDSFAIILPNTLLRSAITISRRFIDIIRDYPFPYEEIQPDKRITISIGVTEYRGHSPEELIYSAEKALKQAIEKGRNRVELSED